MENNEIIKLINKLRKFTHNPNEYKIHEDIIHLTRGKTYFSLSEIYNILRRYGVTHQNNELISLFNKVIKNYVVKTIITIIKDFNHNNTSEFKNTEKRILNNIKLYGKKFNNIEELLNYIYEHDNNVECVFRFIDFNMTWRNTTEGFEYWQNLHQTIRQQFEYPNITKLNNIINKNELFNHNT